MDVLLRRQLLVALGAIALVSSARVAAAEPRARAIVLVVSRMPGADEAALHATVAQAATGSWRPLEPPLSDSDRQCLASPDRSRCAATIATAQRATRALVVVLEKEGAVPTAWFLRGWIFDDHGQSVGDEGQLHCTDDCSLQAVAATAYAFAGKLVDKAQEKAPAPVTVDLEVRVTPSDAQVSIDKGPPGPAGTFAVSPGRHTVTVTRPGYRTTERDVVVDENQEPLSLVLDAQTTSRRTRWPWYVVGGGVVSAGVGAVFLFGLDEDDGVDGNTRHRTYMDWAVSGGTLLGVGVVAIGVGAYGLLRARGEAPPVQVSVGHGGATVGWAGSF